jgi:hypothetical protein
MKVNLIEIYGQTYVVGECNLIPQRDKDVVEKKLSCIPYISKSTDQTTDPCRNFINKYAGRQYTPSNTAAYYEKACLNCACWVGAKYPEVIIAYEKKHEENLKKFNRFSDLDLVSDNE